MSIPVNIAAELDPDEVETADRYTFSLYNRNGEEFHFIVDVPQDTTQRNIVDVWAFGFSGESVVAVGDTSEDGFASFTVGRRTDPL